MVVYGSKVPEIESDWLGEEKDISEGTFLLDFWSYTCRDCSERAEQLSRLHEDGSVEVIGIHAPEFGFEHDEDNLEEAVEDKEIDHPVVVDHDKSTWKSFGNRERPRQVIVKDGEVAWKNAGSSESIEEALKDVLGLEELSELELDKNHSPMLKLGYSDCQGINEEGNFKGEKRLEMPSTRKMNHVYLSGVWKQEEDYLEARENAILKIKFRASEVSAVVKPEGKAFAKVLLDSAEPGKRGGEDVDDGELEAERPDVYGVIEAEEDVQAELTLKLERGTKIYALSFR